MLSPTTPRPLARTKRRIGALVAVLAIVASALVPSTALASGTSPMASPIVPPTIDQSRSAHEIVPAANLANFRAGNIISDAVFFNSASMTQAQVESFLQSKGGACRSGYTCLKDYRQTTPNRAADAYCDGYSGAANESAATIIYKAAVSCGINPQVLIVMLEKEQSLVTHTWPSQWRYDMALGQGCPDTAPCDPAFAGFFYQIYGAARQMQIYAEGRWFTWYAPGKTWNILYNPNQSCGSAPVYIENKATAALYYYTPYQPNAAALRAGYGTGDGCSAYGNRNFYNFFEDWFGSTQGGSSTISAAIESYWAAQGGSTGWVGAPTDKGKKWPDGGTSQSFVGADIFATPSGQVFVTAGAVRDEYRLVGGPASGIGWPSSNIVNVSGGAYQEFAAGRIFSQSGGGTYAIGDPMMSVYYTVSGHFGWPTSRAHPVKDGSIQTFEGGTTYQSAAGTFALDKGWSDWLDSNGGPGGSLGWPSSGQTGSSDSFIRVAFTKGSVFRLGKTAITVRGTINSEFALQGLDGGVLGRPTANATTTGQSTLQSFKGGAIHSSEAGTFTITTFASSFNSLGGASTVGVAQESQRQKGSSYSQRFALLTLTKVGSQTKAVGGAVKREYDRLGGVTSALGGATGAETPILGGAMQTFETGRIVCTSRATVAMTASVAQAWDANGGVAGRLGAPILTAYEVDGTSVQEFVGGVIMTNRKGSAHPIFGLILSIYRYAGGTPTIGAPVSGEIATSAGVYQKFERGVILVPFGAPARALTGAEYEAFAATGGIDALGYPTGTTTSIAGGTTIPFALGYIATSRAGSYALRGVILLAHNEAGSFAGPLGFPIGKEKLVRDGATQLFQGGQAYATPRAKLVTRGVLHREYLSMGGATGSLGWPISNEVPFQGGAQQSFENGTITLFPDGRVVIENK
ncbi:hypothetical protein GCM10009860_07340 [Microbacterium mitrae]|uniref:LGFP repeat-containing protein n=1 Tax=Microbacterium mitrae TaxID=664640 RepID=A0A5C8HPN3_9MICO|nr:hypothetical protein [Microbacterium mitrae]TXK06100.1 hypothetical protein FVP60_03800 [Microbacterium mitrae]